MKTVILTLGLLISFSAGAASQDCRFSNEHLDSETRQMLRSKGYEIVQGTPPNVLFLKITSVEENTEMYNVSRIVESVQVLTRINNLTYDYSEKVVKDTRCDVSESLEYKGFVGLFLRSCAKVDFVPRLIRKAIQTLPRCGQAGMKLDRGDNHENL